MEEVVQLPVGGTCHLTPGKDRIVYAGMPSGDVYSIAQRKDDGYQGYAWNQFCPTSMRDIVIDGVSISVEGVTPDEIRLRIRRRTV